MLLGVRSILDILERERIPVMLYNRAALSFMSGGGDKPHQGVVLEVSPREITEVTEENMQATLQLLEKVSSFYVAYTSHPAPNFLNIDLDWKFFLWSLFRTLFCCFFLS